ncbi:DUF418 domain-containing protein [Thalassotalea sp. Y01]|uniref:DUF418 domain-containing protein n=1 Tax=Thalassotalea sp. Y01 TaxID=2729613 RepID=UPI00145F875C|nr:DUF418 domain-containing protein [Thalassotalea sp. Y01]NMP15465.1 DUF418 domain-containing protein [Thalassotalea sp. Y01]
MSVNTPLRYENIDALRGFALMGLFIVHMVEYFELYWYQPKPGWVHDVVFGLFGGKAYAMFAMLFGVSFYILQHSKSMSGQHFSRLFTRRLALLCLLGYLHGLIYSGDILLVLGVCGFLLVVLQGLSTRMLAVVALLFILQLPLIVHVAWLVGHGMSNGEPLHYSVMGQTFEALAHGSLWDVVINNSANGQLGKWLFFIESGRLYTLIGLFIAGYAIARTGWLFKKNIPYQELALIALMAIGIVVLCDVLSHRIQAWQLAQAELRSLQGVIANYHNTAIMVLEVCVLLALYNLPVCRRLLNSQSAAGRMSLTLYVGQSIVGVMLFYGYAGGLYDSMPQTTALGVAVICWLGQLTLAQYWLARHQYGPLEWLWRSLTYGRKVS